MSIIPTPANPVAGAVGCDFVVNQNRLLFAEFGGNLSRLDLTPALSVVSSGTAVLQGTYTFDLDNGAEGGLSGDADIWWEQETATERAMTVQNTASIINLGGVEFGSLSAGITGLAYSTAAINGNDDSTNQLVNGDVFAVQTTQGNYAKVLIEDYGYDLKIAWVTYQADPAYLILGTGYDQPEDVHASADGTTAYVTERAGTLLRVDLGNANRSEALVITSGINAPQQFVLDEAAGVAYVVEYASPGRLLKVDLVDGSQTVLIDGLQFAVGVALSADLQTAYISEQGGGLVSVHNLVTNVASVLESGFTAPFFLSWANPARTSLLVVERDPANQITSIDVVSGSTQLVIGGLPVRPSSVAVTSPGTALVCCDTEVVEVDFAGLGFQPDGPILQSIGFIPVDWINSAGLADTRVDPSYFFPLVDAPFGGTIPVMVNYLRAAAGGASYYRVLVDGNVRTDPFNGARWDGFEYVGTTVAPQTVNGQPGFYTVMSAAELMLWIQTVPGCYVDSTNLLPSGVTHTITVDLFDSAGNYIESAEPLAILIDNAPSTASLSRPTLNGISATNDCGYLQYSPSSASTDQVQVAVGAAQQFGHANYSVSMIKGVTGLTLPEATSGPVTSVTSPVGDTVANLLGTCSIAGFAASVYVAATANSGWGRQSQYDSSAAIAFVLAP